MKISLLICIGIFLFGNCNGYSVKEIKSGKHLEKAQKAEIDFFFQKRMQNSIKKVIGRNWEIIKEENSKTYFGYLKGSTYEDLYVEDLYYVDSTELSKKFPGYNNLTGIEINRAIYKSNAFQVEHQSTLLQDYKKTFYLKDTGIEAHIRWNYSADGNPEKVKDFIFFLDPNTGKLTDWKSISTN